MKYKNAKDILPTNLLNEIQEYIQGDFIYIPITKEGKVSWGQKNGTKEAIYNRNKSIFYSYERGSSIEEIVINYNLSESSIRKIISKMKKENITQNPNLNIGGRHNE